MLCTFVNTRSSTIRHRMQWAQSVKAYFVVAPAQAQLLCCSRGHNIQRLVKVFTLFSLTKIRIPKGICRHLHHLCLYTRSEKNNKTIILPVFHCVLVTYFSRTCDFALGVSPSFFNSTYLLYLNVSLILGE